MRRRIRLIIEYEGTGFWGFQTQPGRRTVQGVLETSLARIPGAVPRVVAAGRTDAGVHALGLPLHYDTEDRIPTPQIPRALNSLLPEDLRVLRAEEVDPSFHARRHCLWRHYRYRLLNRSEPSALERHRTWWVPQPLDQAAMSYALALLLGEHDFSAFSRREIRPPRRRLLAARLLAQGPELWIEVVGQSFLRGQVRRMVGTLLEAGLGRRSPESVPELLGGGAVQAGPTAPPQGLYFVQGGYTPWDPNLLG
jgi:tRNA pseudouridine38-40 synthase